MKAANTNAVLPSRPASVARRGDAAVRLLPRRAFTLIELLVVIAIIALLATFVTGLTVGAKDRRVRARVKAEIAELEVAIEKYKKLHGSYPPDNTNAVPPGSLLPNSALSSLYHELTTYKTESPQYPSPGEYQFTTNAFGVAGFINAATGADSKNFIPRLKPGRYADLDHDNNPGTPALRLFIAPVDGDAMAPGEDGLKRQGRYNVIHYNSSDPEHNVEGFDLWAEVTLNGQPVEIGNWKD